MKTNKYITWTVVGITTLSAATALARPTIIFSPFVVAPPPPIVVAPAPVVVAPAPVVVAPAPAVTVDVGVPDSYVWDGDEYVGVIGTDYFYLGPGNVWIACDPVRLERFHGWERGHADWREHAIRNEKYRNDTHGHAVPVRSDNHDVRDNHDNHDAHQGEEHHDNDRHDDHSH